jgi:hypothetical protein
MPDAQQQQQPPRKGRGRGKNNSRRCDPQQIERARNWAEWYGVNRLLRGIHPDGLDPEKLREN